MVLTPVIFLSFKKLHSINQHSSLRLKIVDFLDLSLLGQPVYANICIGISLVMFVDMTFVTIQPGYLRELEFSNEDRAIILSIVAGADLSSRISVTVASSFLKIQARDLCLVSVIGTICAQLGKRFVTHNVLSVF